jgi:chaperonin GroES
MMNDSLPRPCGWRILVKVPEVAEKTKGGIILADMTKDNETILTMFAEVVRIGPLAYTRNDMLAGEPWCDPGDTVLISKYAGTRILVDGVEHKILNDDEIQAVIPDPSRVKRA